MSDQKRRQQERKALTGDSEDTARLAHEQNRVGLGRVSRLLKYVDRWIYIEGARMNYLGLLADVTTTAAGEPGELLFETLYRVGDWGREGPRPNNTFKMHTETEAGFPQWLPWCAVDNFGLATPGWENFEKA